jgi:3-dehydroquinate synthase
MANLELYAQVTVGLLGCQYDIRICRNALDESSFLGSLVKTSKVLVVTNDTVAPLYLQLIEEAYKEFHCKSVVLQDGESYKNFDSLLTIYNTLINNKYPRDSTLIALGGGVIGDITGFAAATYQRGIDYIHIPTTLLAQVDSSIGGKTAINHPKAKNMIGSFYQPKQVIIDLNTLCTLPVREFNSGVGEIIKYGLLAGGSFLSQLQHVLVNGLTAKTPELPQLIAQCCRIKASFVETDEKEQGRRALLNLGHTFAHALEAYTQYKQWLHGEAVAIGLYCAAVLSYQMGNINYSMVEEVAKMLECAKLPHQIPREINLERLIEFMGHDKKIKNNQLRFVMIRKFGDCYLDDQITEHSLWQALSASVEGE